MFPMSVDGGVVRTCGTLASANVPNDYIRAKKKNCYVALTDQNKKIGSVGRDFLKYFFLFFFFTYRERVEFPIFFLKFLNGENSGGMQSKRIQVMQVLF